MKRCAAFLLVLIALPALGAQDLDRPPNPADELQLDPVLRGILWSLFEKSRYGFSDVESAAFLIRTPNGGVSFIPWVGSEFENEARWVGPIPKGVIAIAHTHGNRSPRPSTVDAKTARRLGLPVIVITASRIVKTTGGKPQLIARSEWRHSRVSP
jgi:hypothetical protein